METKYLFEDRQSFKTIRQGNHVYVDKTKYIYNLLNGKPTIDCCFLARPRRFGKTLLLDTIEKLFQGDRELFRGLWIDNSDYKFERHPVLKFNMASYTNLKSQDILTGMIKTDLKRFAKKHKISFSSDYSSKMFEELLEILSDKYGKGVVVLVDECDAPVTRYILDRGIARDNLDVLHDFYVVLKASIKFIRLAFVTGIARFAISPLDSGPDNFTDISFKPEFAGICGFTEDDMDTVFGDMYEDTLTALKANKQIGRTAKTKLLKKKIVEYYDGYNWCGKKNVMNPYSLLKFFENKKFSPCWSMSEKPSLLATFARENPLDFITPKLDGHTADDLSILKPATLLFYSGFLTVDHSEIKNQKVDDTKTIPVEEYTFRIPNLEVASVFASTVFGSIFGQQDRFFSNFVAKLPVALLTKDSDETASLLHKLLSAIALQQHERSKKNYHAVIQGAFIAAGIEVIDQTHSLLWKSGMAKFLKKSPVGIEVRCVKTDKKDAESKDHVKKGLAAALEKAADQIRLKYYAAPFRVAGKKITGLAIAVRGRDRVVVRFIEP
ncbi:MAG: AAA family ATPase [Deltaproteobacteria bacterium]|jgi:hypothetical protein|nr:AAA family ATPase [Deltaproteobacteria bacterium]